MDDWKGSTVIYTAVTGGHDHQTNHAYTPGVDYIYFTDGHSSPPSKVWTVVQLHNDLGLDDRRLAKIPKVYPHYFQELRRYKYAIWIDGSMEILNRRFPKEILNYLDNGFVISPHFDGRDCAYGEATIRPPKYANEPLDEQVEHYREEGFPEHFGLYECGVNARDMQNKNVEKLGEMWLKQNLEWSYQDQVSLPYVLWKTGFKPDILPKSWRDMDWLHVNAHVREE